jgi:tetratricopeptide (TPR) repeat protein
VTVTRRALDPDRRAELEEQRSFLLRSLRDLEAEHDAGDLDDSDYEALRDDYTARTADVLRQLDDASDQRRRAEEAAGPRSRGRTVAWVAVVAAFAVLTAVFVAQAAGRRDAGETATGDIRQSTRDLLLDARDRFGSDDLPGAIELYDQVLEIAPTNPEALTYRSWLRWLDSGGTADPDEILGGLDDALASDPSYADALVFRAIVLRDLGRSGEALASLDELDPETVPPFLAERVAGLRAELEGADPFDALLARAAQAARNGDAVAAIELYDQVLAGRPDDVTALAGKGLVLGQVASQAAGDDRSALAASSLASLDRAAELAPGDPIPRWYRAIVLAGLDRTTEAGDIVDELLAGDLAEDLRRDVEALRDRL